MSFELIVNYAQKRLDNKITDYLIENGTLDPTQVVAGKVYTPVSYLMHNNDVASVEFLSNKGADINPAILEAGKQRRFDLVDKWLEYPDADINWAIKGAACAGDFDKADEYLNRTKNGSINSLIYGAAYSGQHDKVQDLLKEPEASVHEAIWGYVDAGRYDDAKQYAEQDEAYKRSYVQALAANGYFGIVQENLEESESFAAYAVEGAARIGETVKAREWSRPDTKDEDELIDGASFGGHFNKISDELAKNECLLQTALIGAAASGQIDWIKSQFQKNRAVFETQLPDIIYTLAQYGYMDSALNLLKKHQHTKDNEGAENAHKFQLRYYGGLAAGGYYDHIRKDELRTSHRVEICIEVLKQFLRGGHLDKALEWCEKNDYQMRENSKPGEISLLMLNELIERGDIELIRAFLRKTIAKTDHGAMYEALLEFDAEFAREYLLEQEVIRFYKEPENKVISKMMHILGDVQTPVTIEFAGIYPSDHAIEAIHKLTVLNQYVSKVTLAKSCWTLVSNLDAEIQAEIKLNNEIQSNSESLGKAAKYKRGFCKAISALRHADGNEIFTALEKVNKFCDGDWLKPKLAREMYNDVAQGVARKIIYEHDSYALEDVIEFATTSFAYTTKECSAREEYCELIDCVLKRINAALEEDSTRDDLRCSRSQLMSVRVHQAVKLGEDAVHDFIESLRPDLYVLKEPDLSKYELEEKVSHTDDCMGIYAAEEKRRSEETLARKIAHSSLTMFPKARKMDENDSPHNTSQRVDNDEADNAEEAAAGVDDSVATGIQAGMS